MGVYMYICIYACIYIYIYVYIYIAMFVVAVLVVCCFFVPLVLCFVSVRVVETLASIPFNRTAFNGFNGQSRLVKLQLQTRNVGKRIVQLHLQASFSLSEFIWDEEGWSIDVSLGVAYGDLLAKQK